MRIISGELGGRRIKVPRNLPIRPTTDQAREGLFNIVSNKVNLEGLNILDLFSGSGMVGLEFISRGSKVTFVEKNIHCIKHISSTLDELNITSKIIKQDVFKFLSNCNTNFDIIFADPPYEHYDLNLFVKNAIKKLNKGGILAIECSSKETLEGFDKIAKFGDTNLLYWKV